MKRELNENLTKVGPGTPAGELLRRYWHPVAAVAELTDEKPIRAVKVLGENLVVYRDKSGRYGMVEEQCPHRLASLAYGTVEKDGIRCRYHGWKFDGTGRCLEMPAEPKNSTYKDEIRHPAYPVKRLGGLLFAYMGPEPAPALPHWDVLTWEKGERWVERHSVLRCNWLQAMENSVDPSHLYWLHGQTAHLAPTLDHYEEEHEFTQFEYGIMKKRTSGGAEGCRVDQHPLLFPTVLRHVFKSGKAGKIMHNLQYRVPMDDVSTQVFMVMFNPNPSMRTPPEADTHYDFVSMTDENGEYRMEMVLAQDVMAWETQGPIFDRTREHLGAADRGIVILRNLLQQQIEAVRKGRIPLGVKSASEGEKLIELDVINERIGLARPQTEAAA
jgi:5,5'-dehydrodivanillate O-demethylase oxygenase subunit